MDKIEKDQEEGIKKENKWWEFYIIRYSMGTVVGAIIVYAIIKTNTDLSSLLMLPGQKNELQYFHFIYLAILGLTYSYIASAPILVFHASRFSFSYSNNKSRCKPLWYALSLIIISTVIILGLFGIILLDRFLLSFILIMFSMGLIVIEWILIIRAVEKIDDNYKFYQTLSNKRKNIDNADIKESYKHLREHGNSFSILFYELLLGSMLYSVYSITFNIQYLIGIILIWVMPAVYVWFVGTALERKFSNT